VLQSVTLMRTEGRSGGDAVCGCCCWSGAVDDNVTAVAAAEPFDCCIPVFK
jgi:hypothetical protein